MLMKILKTPLTKEIITISHYVLSDSESSHNLLPLSIALIPKSVVPGQ
jgi:hypothetical protein